ncbi:MAG: response regulator [Nanobdellota archaeon]
MAKKKILVVDDQYTIRELLEMSLEEDYNILKAEDGKEALELAQNEPPDLIVLDIMMPKMDGFEVCRKLKFSNDTSKIPIIVLTAKHSSDDLKTAISCDVDEYITKPFEPDLLKRRVDFYLQDKESKTKGKLSHFDKTIHYIKKRD